VRARGQSTRESIALRGIWFPESDPRTRWNIAIEALGNNWEKKFQKTLDGQTPQSFRWLFVLEGTHSPLSRAGTVASVRRQRQAPRADGRHRRTKTWMLASDLSPLGGNSKRPQALNICLIKARSAKCRVALATNCHSVNNMVTTRMGQYLPYNPRPRPLRSNSRTSAGRSIPSSNSTATQGALSHPTTPLDSLGLIPAQILCPFEDGEKRERRSGAPSPEPSSPRPSPPESSSPRSPSPLSRRRPSSVGTSAWSASAVPLPSDLSISSTSSYPDPPGESELFSDGDEGYQASPEASPGMIEAFPRRPVQPTSSPTGEPHWQSPRDTSPTVNGLFSRRSPPSWAAAEESKHSPQSPRATPAWTKMGGGFYYAAGPTIPRVRTWRDIQREILGCCIMS